MGEKRWPMILFTIIMVALIFNFLNTLFKSDVKRYAPDRIFVDYASYYAPTAVEQHRAHKSYSPTVSRDVSVARASMGRHVSVSIQAAEKGMAERLARLPKTPTPDERRPDAEYDEMERLGKLNHPGFDYAQRLYQDGRFESALAEYSNLMNSLPSNDLFHRIKIYEAVAECYFRTGNDDGYIQYKIRHIQAMRHFGRIAARAYPSAASHDFGAWFSVEEATRNLLRSRANVVRLGTDHAERQARRAQLDLEISRRL